MGLGFAPILGAFGISGGFPPPPPEIQLVTLSHGCTAINVTLE